MSSNEKMVMVPRELLARLDLGKNTATALAALPELRAILAKPSDQPHGEPVAEVIATGGPHDSEDRVLVELQAELPPIGTKLYTHADPSEVERLRNEIRSLRQHKTDYMEAAEETANVLRADLVTVKADRDAFAQNALDLRAQLAERDALRSFANEIISAAYEGGSFEGGDIQDMAVKHGLLRIESRAEECGKSCACLEYGFPAECYRKTALLSASAEPSAPKCKGWTCFHCDEHFTDSEAAAIHFGTHENQRPACLIDADEYRSMEARVRECDNEDSELHQQMHRQANEHKLELRRAEESGYAKGLADASAPVERDERAEFESWYIRDVGVGLANLKRCNSGSRAYEEDDAMSAWEGWQARATLERKP